MNDFKLKHGYFRYYVTLKPSVFSRLSLNTTLAGELGALPHYWQVCSSSGSLFSPHWHLGWERTVVTGHGGNWAPHSASTDASLAGMCRTPSYCPYVVSTDTGQGWQGKLYYHQVGMKLPVPYSALSNTTLQRTWGTARSPPGKDGSLGCLPCFCWHGWDHSLFCGVRLEWSSFCFVSS